MCMFKILFAHKKSRKLVNYETFDLSQLASADLVLYAQKFYNQLFTTVNFFFPCVCRNSRSHTEMRHWEMMKLFDLSHLASADLLLSAKSFEMNYLLKTISTIHASMRLLNSVCAQKWDTGKLWNYLMLANSCRQTLSLHSNISLYISKSDSHFDFSVRVESGKRKWEVETSGSRKKLNGPRGDA
jgi:hypothetical protein